MAKRAGCWDTRHKARQPAWCRRRERGATAPVPDIRPGDLVGHLSDAVTCNRCGNRHLHFIGGEASRHRDRFLPARSVQHPVSIVGRWARNDAVMASKVRRRYRDAPAGEVVRAGAQDSMRRAELAGDQCRVRKNPGAKSEVDAVFDQIERVIREAQLDFGSRISRKKVKRRAPQEMAAKAYRSRNAGIVPDGSALASASCTFASSMVRSA